MLKRHEKKSTTLRSILFVLVAFVAVLVRYYTSKNWYLLPPISREKFNIKSNYTILSVPTTYYEPHKMGDVLPKWHQSLGPYIHVYRQKSGEFKADLSGLNSNTFSKTMLESCKYPESMLCLQCFDMVDQPINTKDILDSVNSRSYAQFAILEDSSVVDKVFESLEAPGIKLKEMQVEQAFVSNFNTSILTAAVHCNQLSSSAAVQFADSKSWIFFSPQVYNSDTLLNSYTGAGFSVPTQAPDEPYEVYLYTSQPGDVLFFSENWGHAVYTHKGANVMFTLRHFEIKNFLRDPLRWTASFFNKAWFKPKAYGTHLRNLLTEELYRHINPMCSFDEGNTPWDQEMLKLLKEHVNTNAEN